MYIALIYQPIVYCLIVPMLFSVSIVQFHFFFFFFFSSDHIINIFNLIGPFIDITFSDILLIIVYRLAKYYYKSDDEFSWVKILYKEDYDLSLFDFEMLGK